MLLLSGCTAAPAPTPSRPAAHPTPTSSPAPTLHPDGAAAENLPLFTMVVDQVWASPSKTSAQAYVDALATAGFTRADMQMTADASTVGNPAESIQFSVRWGSTQCLVGQVGPSTGDPVTAVLPQLAGGRCLIGTTPSTSGAQ
ncbi:DUF6993 domain-containing protein [Microbacterium sp. NPDC089698]|uniref:DUF6993 domain-containing protein n=1 Tax=Microbacterium sp. NPDC089698 TaxID=3364200 RepID=UPI00381344D6